MYKQAIQCSKSNTPNYATHGNTYTILFYLPQAPSHKHLHKNPIKEKRKGVATSFCASSHSTTAFEPVPRASRASRLFVGSLARVARGSDLCLVLSSAHSLVRFSSTDSRAPPSSCPSPALSLVRLSSTDRLVRFLSQLSQVLTQKKLFTFRPALFWTRSIRTRQSGEDTPPLPLPLLASETGR